MCLKVLSHEESNSESLQIPGVSLASRLILCRQGSRLENHQFFCVETSLIPETKRVASNKKLKTIKYNSGIPFLKQLIKCLDL